MGAYADNCDKFFEHGFIVVPIIPGEKKPGYWHGSGWWGMTNWQRRKHIPDEKTPIMWGARDTGLGVVTGPPSKGTVALDIDVDDPAIVAAVMGLLPETEVEKRGAKGKTLFYRGLRLHGRNLGKSTKSRLLN
jgi:hypothetical protein